MFELFLPVYLAAIVHMMKPGPGIMAMTSLVISGYWRSALIFWSTDIIAGTFIYFILLGGLSLIPESFGLFFMFLKAGAASLFISMGFLSLQKEIAISDDSVEARKEKITKGSAFSTMGAAVLMSLSNPFNIILILAVIPAMLNATSFTWGEIGFIRFTTFLANVTIYSAYCIPLFFLRKKLGKNILNKIRYIASFAMIAIGAYIFINMLTQSDLYKTGLLG
jgi:threonine/homoserine/homoserine lactone efflux protein